jgi:protein tyrosine/serine phosphatase
LKAFRRLSKPVLLHCSAGIDRTPPVAAYLCDHEQRWQSVLSVSSTRTAPKLLT